MILYYVIVVAGLIIAVLLSIVLQQIFQKLKRQRKLSPQMNIHEQIAQHNPLEESIYHEIDELSTSEPATSRGNSYLSIEEHNSMKNSEENTTNDEETLGVDDFMTSCTSVAFTNRTTNNELSTKKQDVDDGIPDEIEDCITSDTNDDLVRAADDDDDSDNDTIIETTDIDGYLSPYHALSTIRYKQDYE
ncbi:unnamed protein product [Mytilus coruscus]|uniref:Uncharacterized protein n=1 Tax=Mytilus coruscus TaxID=42192 RepID=A0A6J8EV73_MYTCO|nr:unnamed protein product [Mytilus coruscus]